MYIVPDLSSLNQIKREDDESDKESRIIFCDIEEISGIRPELVQHVLYPISITNCPFV